MEKKRLLAILAHPDDETFGIGGTLAKYSREGVDVHVAIATDGAAGSVIKKYENDRDKLVQIRKKELDKAVKILGVKLHKLGYRDSGYIGDPAGEDPKAFINIAETKAIEKIVKLIRKIKPDVVVTHDETGGYLHPDHIQCWKIVTPAFRAAGDKKKFKNAGKPFLPSKLFYTVFPKSKVRYYSFLMRIKGQNPKKAGRNKDIDMTFLGVERKDIHAIIDIRKYWNLKKKASEMHESQGGKERRHMFLPEFFQKVLFGKECYILANSHNNKTGECRNDLFGRD